MILILFVHYVSSTTVTNHFTVVCLVAWLLIEIKAGVELVLIETFDLFSFVFFFQFFFFANDTVLLRTRRNLHSKSCEVSIIASSITKHKVGWEIELSTISLKNKRILAFFVC